MPTSPYLSSSNAALVALEDASFTVAGWVTPPESGVAVTLVSAPAFKIVLKADGKIAFTIRHSPTAVETTVTSSNTVDEDDWNCFIAVYDTTNLTLTVYVNNVATSVSYSADADSSTAKYSTDFRLGTSNNADTATLSAEFDLDSVSVWARALSEAEASALYNLNQGSDYPFLGGPFSMVFQGRITGGESIPLTLGAGPSLYSVTKSDSAGVFIADLDLLYFGNPVTRGYSWTGESFTNKLIFAQHDNPAQYWTPPLPMTARPLPGLPSDDATWDGVTVFKDHVLLWKDARLKWSDAEDFAAWIPISQTVNSAVLTLANDFVQPAIGGQVTVTVSNPVAEVRSLSLTSTLSFPSTAVGDSEELLLTITNSGNVPVTVTGLSMPDGFSGSFSGVIAVGQAQPVVVTFTPTEAKTYNGVISVASDATTGSSSVVVTGTGTGSTKVIALSGTLAFGNVKVGNNLVSSLVIENQGNATLTVSALTLPTGFTGSFAGTIAAGAKQIVAITFAPSAATSYSGDILVTSDATSGSESFPVSGQGVSRFARTTVFITDNGSLQFGKVPIVPPGSAPTGTLRIYNPTGDGFKVLGLTLPAGFTGNFTGNIAAHSFQDVTITFTPVDTILYAGTLTVAVNHTNVDGALTLGVSGTGTTTGKVLSLSGELDFGQVAVTASASALLRIENVGDDDVTVTSITVPAGFSATYAGVIAPGDVAFVLVTFAPTSAIDYSGTLTVNSDATGTNTKAVTGTGFDLPDAAPLVEGQFIRLNDTQGAESYYDFYEVVSMTDNTTLVLKRMDLTGGTPSGTTISADGKQFFTVDANESGEKQIVGAQQNGPIFKVVPQGDYAYSFKERSIQSIQYVGLTSGVFFIHPEINDEGLISREAIVDLGDGTMAFLGHKHLYRYSGGPSPTPVCLQATTQLYSELDRSRLYTIRLFHNENRKEVWVSYPVIGGGFRVLIWNYQEDSASFDDYDSTLLFTAFGQADWTKSDDSVERLPLLASADGNLRIHGRVFSRDGVGYISTSETMDFDFQEPDIWKYVDVVVLGLDVRTVESTPRLLSVQIGSKPALSGADITWTPVKTVLVNGHATIPVKVNPGGAGRYLRLRLTSSDADVQWRVSSFEIHCRPGGLY